MVANATDLGEVRAAAEILGHSPEMLMKTYSHAFAGRPQDRDHGVR